MAEEKENTKRGSHTFRQMAFSSKDHITLARVALGSLLAPRHGGHHGRNHVQERQEQSRGVNEFSWVLTSPNALPVEVFWLKDDELYQMLLVDGCY